MIKTVAVVGAGTMGNGIAHVFAQASFKTVLIDVNPEQLERAQATIAQNIARQMAKGLLTETEKTNLLNCLSTTTSLMQGVAQADLVVEAATENETIKLDIFKQMDAAAPLHAILATNTSSISITKIAAATKRAGQVIGMHFMNPVPVMKLVEVINGYNTSQATTATVVATCEQLQKTPCIVNDYPGFVANRILMPMINEAIGALHEGVANVQAIDTVMKLGMAHPMGPLQLADFIGLDVCLAILRVLHQGFGNAKYAPCVLLSNMVAAGKLGVKTGEGFYTYQSGTKISGISSQFAATIHSHSL
ncbi:MAG: 3-hydroxybutyryl-CoA dehydrogenase [Bacteroidetes bacterium]|nr:MAG: 3-hydroxybutyryl-CoA dehydrogenase [Bacteroidota bacterium]